MSHKFSLIPIGIIVLVGAVWASTGLFPDKPDAGFPARPSSPGTLAYVLDTYFDTDGKALSGAALGGTGASGYLKGTNCSPQEVWRGIDADGYAICKGPALAFAEIYEGTMQVNGTIQPIGTILYEGDRIETDATQTGTIRFTHNPVAGSFTADISIARLGTGTTVLIDRGDTAGTLALIDLQDGLLWGRILSSTGIDFGGGGLIAGVRGTSVSVEKSGPQYTLSVIDSQNPTNAATLSSVAQGAVANPTPQPLAHRKTIQYTATNTSPNLAVGATPLDRTALYSTSIWARENTKKDIIYLKSLSTSPVAVAELAITDPILSAEKEALCDGVGTSWETGTNTCVTTLAYADSMDFLFTDGESKGQWALRSPNGSIYIPAEYAVQSSSSGRISYDLTILNQSWNFGPNFLNGKKLTIDLDAPLNLPPPTTTNGTSSQTIRYIFDGGTIRYWAVNGKCTDETNIGKKICQRKGDTTIIYSDTPEFISLNPTWNIESSKKISLNIIDAQPNRFIMGAQFTTDTLNPYKNQINPTITRISIH